MGYTPPERCTYAAPYICYQDDQTHIWNLMQGCCNHWDCPRCGIIRAKQEYARMVTGAELLEQQQKKLYFWTITCKGKEMSKAEAEEGYLIWTHSLMRRCWDKCHRANEYWCYVQVTERQKRGHPHSHIITTYVPDDQRLVCKGESLPNGRVARHVTLWSEWFRGANVRAGLGIECEISPVKSAAAVSRYVGKYLFKQTNFDQWPARWKRVRYSKNWPDLPERKNQSAFPVIKYADWFRMWDIGEPIRADSVFTYAAAQARGIENVLPPAW